MADKHLARLRFPAHAAHLRAVRARMRETLQGLDLPFELAEEMILAVNEACMNIIQHAYGKNPSRDQDIVLDIVQATNELVFRLTDFADPIDRSALRPRDLSQLRPGGLGLHIINHAMDSAHFEPPTGAGNVLEMRRRISSGPR